MTNRESPLDLRERGDLPKGRSWFRPALLHDEFHQLRAVPEYEVLDLVLASRSSPHQRLAADGTILRCGRHDHVAVWADMGLKSRLLLLTFRVFKAVDPPELPFDILPGEVGIGAEHLGMDRPPHDQLDHTL